MYQTISREVLFYWSKKKLTKQRTQELINILKLRENEEDNFIRKGLKGTCIFGIQRIFFIMAAIDNYLCMSLLFISSFPSQFLPCKTTKQTPVEVYLLEEAPLVVPPWTDGTVDNSS